MTIPAAELVTHATLAARAVLDASLVTRHVQLSLAQVQAITKDDRSPVTVADYAAQAVVAYRLRRELGKGVVLVGEEDPEELRQPAHAPHRAAALEAVQLVWPECTEEDMLDAIELGTADPKSGEPFWTLDPVDGTKGFLRNQQYAVALGYIDQGQPVIGAMGCPNLPRSFDASLASPDAHGSLYLATKGQGVREWACTERAMDEAPAQINRAASYDRPFTVTASVEKAHSSVSDTDRVLDRLAASGVTVADNPVRLDSQAKYSVVARGQADAYLRLPAKKGYVEKIWDHAAGAIIAAEAGCTVTDIAGTPLDFSHGRRLEVNKGIVCASPAEHDGLIDGIRTLGIGRG